MQSFQIIWKYQKPAWIIHQLALKQKEQYNACTDVLRSFEQNREQFLKLKIVTKHYFISMILTTAL
jgi:hypothetical protein